ncbi:NAD(P)-dependent dehydrogenase (short-subunit alcohol dehydrogenase family) [Methylobacterium sp. BE186]|uniref:SDR family NAD(P)-dependent oxidoreductase n=1 Tax=Methylobacterium sp. BE186 TaxID=2817715 RepID=UPI00285C551D|nr:SDR family NAD(P)-dependent oxidoreductase [Methylobacterium sp. BE186]MDR7040520.1 NAD(P)-dependent dehydrogenase (short-subunit alcohol dehydrogenase family) [Methylobacterium sp. BE186]
MRQSEAAVVVGMGPGLGLALARRFARGGFSAVGIARTPDKVPAEEAIEVRQADASDAAGLDAALRSIEADRGPITVLIYNAYRVSIGSPGIPTPSDLATDLQVNVVGAYAAVRTTHSLMLPRGRGIIILTGGGLAIDPRPWPDAFSLSAGKAALRNLAYSMSEAFKADGVTVATMTITGRIQEGTPFAPDLIADAVWRLHLQGARAGPEVVFTGAGAPTSSLSLP